MMVLPVLFLAIYKSEKCCEGFLHDCFLPDCGTDILSGMLLRSSEEDERLREPETKLKSFSWTDEGRSQHRLPPVSGQYVQRGHTNTSFNRCAFPFSSVDCEQRFAPPNETQPYKHLSIVL
jgi:hypothetical protein